jgi:hypothetical protein
VLLLNELDKQRRSASAAEGAVSLALDALRAPEREEAALTTAAKHLAVLLHGSHT